MTRKFINPGPWSCRRSTAETWEVNGSHHGIDGPHYIATNLRESHATLIAAAPDLLKAAQQLLSADPFAINPRRPMSPRAKALLALRDAINKATGGEA